MTQASLIDLDFPGVMPARQKRSRETTAALLHAGDKLLRAHRLEELSIESLCAEVGVTVGAFYSRFESKDAYFNALLGLASRDGEHGLASMLKTERIGDASLESTCNHLVHGAVIWMRRHEGVLRAALHRGDSGPESWMTFKSLARDLVARVTPLMMRRMSQARRAAKTRAVDFGFQVVFGTLVNAILNDPGPVSLHDDEMIARLSQCLRLLLLAEIEQPGSSPPRKPRRAGRLTQPRKT